MTTNIVGLTSLGQSIVPGSLNLISYSVYLFHIRSGAQAKMLRGCAYPIFLCSRQRWKSLNPTARPISGYSIIQHQLNSSLRKPFLISRCLEVLSGRFREVSLSCRLLPRNTILDFDPPIRATPNSTTSCRTTPTPTTTSACYLSEPS